MDQGIEYTDDSSQALGLGHGYTDPDADLPPQNHLLHDPRWNEIENRRLQRACEEQGIPYGPSDEPTNEGAYAAIERRTRELQAEGYSLIEGSVIARGEQCGAVDRQVEIDPHIGGDECTCAHCNRVTPATLQPELGKIHSGSRKGRRHTIARPSADGQVKYDRLLGEVV